MRPSTALLSVVLAAHGAPSVLAQDGGFDAPTSVERFLSDARLFGADTATVERVSQDGDTLSVEGVLMQWALTFRAGDATAGLTASATIPDLQITGLSVDGNGHRVEQIAMPLVDLSIALTGAEDAGEFAYDFTITDYVLHDARWGPFPVVTADAERPASRFAPLIDWAVGVSYEENAVGGVTGTANVDGETSEIVYGPLSFGPVRDGAANEFTYGPLTQTQRMTVPGEEEQQTVEMDAATGAVTGTGLNVKPIAALLTGTEAQPGPQTVLRTLSVPSMTFSGEDVVEGQIGQLTIENFTVDPSSGPLLEMIDDLVLTVMSGEAPDPAMPLSFVLDMYGAFAFDLYSIQDVVFQTPDANLQLGGVEVRALSRNGLGRFELTDLKAQGPEAEVTLGSFAMDSYEFPRREAIERIMATMALGAQPDIRQVLDVIPTLENLAVSDFSVTTPAGPFRLDQFETSLGNYIPPVPTEVEMMLDGLTMPLAFVDNEMAAEALASMGANPLSMDGIITLRWNEDAQRVEMTTDLNAENVGRVAANATLSGIPRLVFADPVRAPEAIATAALNGLSARFTNAGLAEFFINMLSAQAGVSAEEFADGMAQQAQFQVGLLTGDQALASEMANAVRAFISEPRSFSVTATPQAPVSFAQLLGAAMTAPNQIPALLDLSISANQR